MSDFAVDDETVADDSLGLLDKFRSRPKQLARWLLQSRDKLKAKYRELKVDLKRLKVRVTDVSKSRDIWKQRSESSEQQLRAMQAEVERLTATIEQTEASKKTRNANKSDDIASSRFAHHGARSQAATNAGPCIDHPARTADR